jgi:hypothetical protein
LNAEDLQADQVSELLCEGVAAVKAGQNERARDLLVRVVAHDDQNAQAWLWLSGVVESLEDRKVCLENVLNIDPDNAAARKGLAWVQQQMQRQAEEQAASSPEEASPFTVSPEVLSTDAASLVPAPESPVVQRARTPVSHAAALLREDFVAAQPAFEPPETLTPVAPLPSVLGDSVESQPVPEPEPASPPSILRDEFTNEYGCPYCAAATKPDDRKCKLCGKDLWVKFRKQEKPSGLLWVLLALQLGNGVYALAPVLVLLVLESSFINAMLGVSEIPPVLLLALALPGLFSLSLAAGLYFRWKPVYYMLFADAGLGLLLAFASFAFGADLFIGGLYAVMAIARLVMIFQLGGRFRVGSAAHSSAHRPRSQEQRGVPDEGRFLQ